MWIKSNSYRKRGDTLLVSSLGRNHPGQFPTESAFYTKIEATHYYYYPTDTTTTVTVTTYVLTGESVLPPPLGEKNEPWRKKSNRSGSRGHRLRATRVRHNDEQDEASSVRWFPPIRGELEEEEASPHDCDSSRGARGERVPCKPRAGVAQSNRVGGRSPIARVFYDWRPKRSAIPPVFFPAAPLFLRSALPSVFVSALFDIEYSFLQFF